jgi:hypothetical protein
LRQALLGAVLAVPFALAACGGGGNSAPPPQGPPTLRHPAAQVAASLDAEVMRAHLVAASSLYGVGRRAEAQQHMNAAETGYVRLTDLVRAKDPILDREINAAFGVIAGQISAGEAPPQVTNRMGLVQGQLLDAAITDSVDLAARNDPTVGAQVLLDLANQGDADYAAVAAAPGTPAGRRAFQDSFGLLTRALAIARNLKGSFGPQANAATNAAGGAHNDGFPLGVLEPKPLQRAKVAADVARLRAAVARRFRLG